MVLIFKTHNNLSCHPTIKGGQIGDGKIFIMPVEEVIRIRSHITVPPARK